MESSSRILVVDDDPSARATVEALLFGRGYDLEFACSGMEALAKASQQAPDLVLLDVMMPDLDGFEVCERLRSDPQLAQIPVVMVTALDDRGSRLRGITAGADDLLTKPIDGTELRARVKTITQLNRYRRLLTEHARFQWVVEQASDGYVMIDADDRIQYTNPQARLYLGLDQSGEHASATGHPGTFMEVVRRQYGCEPAEAWADWPPASAAWRPDRYLVRPESSTAKSFWLEVDLLDPAPHQSVDRLVHLRDITSQVVQDLEMRNFHDMVAHKMRTPLSSTLVSLGLLEKQRSQLEARGLGELLTSVSAGTRRLRDAIEGILEHIDASSLTRSCGGFALAEVQFVVAEIRARLGIQSISVTCPQEMRNSQIQLSRRAIELILWEIMENAVKFHPRRAPAIEIEIAPAGSSHVVLRVSDDGIVLSPEQLGRIWRPYYQGEKYFTGQAAGMGLGLATVSALVWEAGGQCRASGRQNGPGLVIDLSLPLCWTEGRL